MQTYGGNRRLCLHWLRCWKLLDGRWCACGLKTQPVFASSHCLCIIQCISSLSLCVRVCLSVVPSFCNFSLSVSQSVSQSVCLSVYLSLLSICLLSVCPSVSQCPFLCLIPCLTIILSPSVCLPLPIPCLVITIVRYRSLVTKPRPRITKPRPRSPTKPRPSPDLKGQSNQAPTSTPTLKNLKPPYTYKSYSPPSFPGCVLLCLLYQTGSDGCSRSR
jgi:hypothetical protein